MKGRTMTGFLSALCRDRPGRVLSETTPMTRYDTVHQYYTGTKQFYRQLYIKRGDARPVHADHGTVHSQYSILFNDFLNIKTTHKK